MGKIVNLEDLVKKRGKEKKMREIDIEEFESAVNTVVEGFFKVQKGLLDIASALSVVPFISLSRRISIAEEMEELKAYNNKIREIGVRSLKKLEAAAKKAGIPKEIFEPAIEKALEVLSSKCIIE